jgi:hypothetical protein
MTSMRHVPVREELVSPDSSPGERHTQGCKRPRRVICAAAIRAELHHRGRAGTTHCGRAGHLGGRRRYLSRADRSSPTQAQGLCSNLRRGCAPGGAGGRRTPGRRHIGRSAAGSAVRGQRRVRRPWQADESGITGDGSDCRSRKRDRGFPAPGCRHGVAGEVAHRGVCLRRVGHQSEPRYAVESLGSCHPPRPGRVEQWQRGGSRRGPRAVRARNRYRRFDSDSRGSLRFGRNQNLPRPRFPRRA